MKRIIVLLTVVALMMAMLPMSIAPAFARACYELGRKSHRNADSTVGLVPSRSLFPAFLSRF